MRRLLLGQAVLLASMSQTKLNTEKKKPEQFHDHRGQPINFDPSKPPQLKLIYKEDKRYPAWHALRDNPYKGRPTYKSRPKR